MDDQKEMKKKRNSPKYMKSKHDLKAVVSCPMSTGGDISFGPLARTSIVQTEQYSCCHEKLSSMLQVGTVSTCSTKS